MECEVLNYKSEIKNVRAKGLGSPKCHRVSVWGHLLPQKKKKKCKKQFRERERKMTAQEEKEEEKKM